MTTRETPASTVWEASKPQCRKTASMRRFSGSTSASKTEIPFSRAISASRSRSAVPIPWPCRASAIVNATSARSGPAPVSVETSDRHDPLSRLPDEREVVLVIHPRQVGGALRVGRGHAEKPKVEAGRGEPLVEIEQAGVVRLADRPEAQRGAVAQHDVALVARKLVQIHRRLFRRLHRSRDHDAGLPGQSSISGQDLE